MSCGNAYRRNISQHWACQKYIFFNERLTFLLFNFLTRRESLLKSRWSTCWSRLVVLGWCDLHFLEVSSFFVGCFPAFSTWDFQTGVFWVFTKLELKFTSSLAWFEQIYAWNLLCVINGYNICYFNMLKFSKKFA